MIAMVALRIILGKISVSIFEVDKVGEDRILSVDMGNVPLGRIRCRAWDSPGVALALPRLYIWAGATLYQLEPDRQPKSCEAGDEIHSVYALESTLCLVCELSLRLLNAELQAVAHMESTRVLGTSWWDGDILNVDAEGALLRFRLMQGALIEI